MNTTDHRDVFKYVLMLFDSGLSSSLKDRVASQLNIDLKDNTSRDYALDILLSAPMPSECSVKMPWKWRLLRRRVYKVLNQILSSQDKIRRLNSKFEAAISKCHTLDTEAKLLKGIMASGPYRLLVINMNEQGSVPIPSFEDAQTLAQELLEKSFVGFRPYPPLKTVFDEFFSTVASHSTKNRFGSLFYNMFQRDFYWPIHFRRLHDPKTLKFRYELSIGYHIVPISGFWFQRF